MEREEKVLDVALDTIVNRVQDVKNSLQAFLLKLENEYETMTWPSVLDSFALLSGQVNTLLKILKNDKLPPFRNRVVLPLVLSPDRDEELLKVTENRVQAFNHEVVPDYLRTKPIPEVEAKEQQSVNKATQMSIDAAQKQITSMNKIANNIIEVVKSLRDEYESEAGQRTSTAQTYSLTDTNTIMSAICLGKGFKPTDGSLKSQPGTPSPQTQLPRPSSSGGKAPSTIKTNIKSAAALHPYGR